MIETLMAAENLSVTFHDAHRPGQPVRALEGVSLEIGRGEILGLVGESGSGKTTLGKTLLRLYRPSGGRVLLEGADLARLSERRLRPYRRRLQMVFQDPLSSFNPRHTIGSAIAGGLSLHGLCQRAELGGTVASILDDVGLPPAFAQRYPHEMSGGQLQRAAIARALSLAPDLIVADEAVSKLDVSVRAQILNLLRRLHAARGISMLFITHDLEVARFLCHRIGVMRAGRLLEIGPTADLFAHPLHEYTRDLLSTIAPRAETPS